MSISLLKFVAEHLDVLCDALEYVIGAVSDSYAATAPSASYNGKPLTAAPIEDRTLEGSMDREAAAADYMDAHIKAISDSERSADRSYPGLSERLIDTSLYSFATEADFVCVFRHVFDEHSERCGAIILKSVAPRGLRGARLTKALGARSSITRTCLSMTFTG